MTRAYAKPSHTVSRRVNAAAGVDLNQTDWAIRSAS